MIKLKELLEAQSGLPGLKKFTRDMKSIQTLLKTKDWQEFSEKLPGGFMEKTRPEALMTGFVMYLLKRGKIK